MSRRLGTYSHIIYMRVYRAYRKHNHFQGSLAYKLASPILHRYLDLIVISSRLLVAGQMRCHAFGPGPLPCLILLRVAYNISGPIAVPTVPVWSMARQVGSDPLSSCPFPSLFLCAMLAQVPRGTCRGWTRRGCVSRLRPFRSWLVISLLERFLTWRWRSRVRRNHPRLLLLSGPGAPVVWRGRVV